MGLTATLTACAGAAGVLGAAFALRSASQHLARAIVTAAAAAALIGLALPLLLLPLRLDTFGVIHAVYLFAVVTVPCLGMGLLAASFRGGRRRAGPIRALAALLISPALVGYYATHVEPKRLKVDRVEVPVSVAKLGERSVRIGVLADIQSTRLARHERRAVADLVAMRPDIILVAGDVFEGTRAERDDALQSFRRLLRRLSAPAGVFIVRGDTDSGDNVDRLVEGLPIRVLDDEIVEVRVHDRLLRLGGNRLRWSSPAALRVRRELDVPSDAINVLLSHRPDPIRLMPPDGNIDIVVAGHTHGGQLVLPGFGPLFTATHVDRRIARGGLHVEDGNRIYVSTGVGMTREQAPQFRLFARPSIGILTLRDE